MAGADGAMQTQLPVLHRGVQRGRRCPQPGLPSIQLSPLAIAFILPSVECHNDVSSKCSSSSSSSLIH